MALEDILVFEVSPAPVPPEAWHGLRAPVPTAPEGPTAVQALMDAGAAVLDGAAAAMDAAAQAAVPPAPDAPQGVGQLILRGVFGYLRRRGRTAATAMGTAAVAGLLASSSTSSSSSSSSVAPPREEPHAEHQ